MWGIWAVKISLVVSAALPTHTVVGGKTILPLSILLLEDGTLKSMTKNLMWFYMEISKPLQHVFWRDLGFIGYSYVLMSIWTQAQAVAWAFHELQCLWRESLIPSPPVQRSHVSPAYGMKCLCVVIPVTSLDTQCLPVTAPC